MTLDIEKFISNAIKTQAKIQHLDVNTKTVKKNNIPESVTKIITKEYGKKYLLDSDYVSFFWGGLDKDNIEKLFNVVDKALGKSANKLTDKDFKKLNINSSEISSKQEETSDEDDEDIEIEDEVEDIVDDEPDESFDAEEEIEDKEKLNEDEAEDEVSSKPTSYFFLKITLK